MRFDLSGRAVLELVGAEEPVARYVTGQMDPFPPGDASDPAPDLVLESSSGSLERTLVEVQHAADDDLVTATDGRRLFVEWDHRRCCVPDALEERPARFEYEPGFPVWRIFRQAVRPALQMSMVANGALAVHAASVEIEGGGLVVAGWSESGKTETALGLMESGARFLSDKWTILGADGEASAFPISVGIRRWVLRYLPTLRASLTPTARAQFAAVGVAGLLLEPAGRRSARGRSMGMAVDSARRAMALGDRAAFSVRDLRAVYGQSDDPTRRVPTRAVALLVNVPGEAITTQEADPAWASARLARSAAFERRAYFNLMQRAAYAVPSRPVTLVERAVAQEEELLRTVLSSVRLLAVRAPFPTDPRLVADAILRAL